MKVLHITNNYPTKEHPIFGIFVKEQIDALSELEVKNDLFFFNTREKGRSEYFFGFFRLIKLLFVKKYDVIHCHHAYTGFMFLLTGISVFKKKILSYQGTPDIEGGALLFKIHNIFFNKIILKATFVDYKSKKTMYFPNGINMDFFNVLNQEKCKKELGLEINKKYILFMDSYVGRPYKRYDRYKEVMEILNYEYKMPEVVELVLTNTKRELIPKYMNASSLHLLTSDVEGSPNSVKECLSCNTPVVATPVGDVKELMGDIKGCFISKTFDSKELAELCYKAFKIKEFEGRTEFTKKRLDSKTVALNLLDIYKKIELN